MLSYNFLKRLFTPIKKDPIMYLKAFFNGFIQSILPIFSIIIIESITKNIETGDTLAFWNNLRIFLIVGVVVILITIAVKNRGWVALLSKGEILIYDDIIRKFLRGDNTFVEKLGTGKVLSIIQKGIKSWSGILLSISEALPKFLITFLYTSYLLVKTGRWLLALFILIMVSVNIFITWINLKIIPLRNISRDIENQRTRIFVKIIMSKFEILQNNKIDYEISTLNDNSLARYANDKSRSLYLDLFFRVPKAGIFIITLLTYGFVGYGVLQHNFSFSDLVVFVGALTLTEALLGYFVYLYSNIVRESASVEKLRETLDSLPSIQHSSMSENFVFRNGDITFKNISFGYEDKNILEKLSLYIEGGKKTAFVGNSGGGKTTLMKLIAGYIKPDKGDIEVDTQKLSKIKLESYYANIGYLSQDPNVFDGTIYENLIYALNNKPDKELLEKVVRLAKCEFIFEFADGFDTEIGEKGVRLSGGQKQRLAIARIMLKNPNIILLDEPTSALDSFNEEQISIALDNLFKGKTTIVIAHRLQTVKKADRILLLEEGKIIEDGNHKELVKLNGKYKKMLDLQSGF